MGKEKNNRSLKSFMGKGGGLPPIGWPTLLALVQLWLERGLDAPSRPRWQGT